MGLLDELTGGGNRRADYQHFTDRYDQGQPHEGYDDQEVASRYNEVTSEVDPSTYRDAAQQAFTRMDPDQRREFGAQLNQHAAAQGQQSDYPDSASYEDPQQLANMTTRLHQQSPGLLSQLLSGAGVGGTGPPGGLTGAGNSGAGVGGAVGGILGGILGGNSGRAQGAGGNPLAKAAMAGIASYAAKQLMNRR